MHRRLPLAFFVFDSGEVFVIFTTAYRIRQRTIIMAHKKIVSNIYAAHAHNLSRTWHVHFANASYDRFGMMSSATNYYYYLALMT